jgi:hypothetical protein
MADTMTEEDEAQLLHTFKELGVKPKADNKEDLEEWMLAYLKDAGKMNPEKSDKGDTSKHVLQPSLRISTFSGEPPGKGDTSFDLWRYEVHCVLLEGQYSKETVRHAVWKSLKGEAGKMVMRLGISASIGQILEKLQSIYGPAEVGQDLLADFYCARQKPDETVASWSCRLEDLLQKAKEGGQVHAPEERGLLRERFWTGLLQPLKDSSRHKYDTIRDYDDLVIHMRRIEIEHKDDKINPDVRKKAPQVKAITTTDDNLKREIGDLKTYFEKKFDDLKQEMGLLKSGSHTRHTYPQGSQDARQQFDTNDRRNSGPVCFRCGQQGHFQFGCRTRLPIGYMTPQGPRQPHRLPVSRPQLYQHSSTHVNRLRSPAPSLNGSLPLSMGTQWAAPAPRRAQPGMDSQMAWWENRARYS